MIRVFILCTTLIVSSFAQTSFSLKYVQSVTINTQKKFQSTKLGGFSALKIEGNSVYVVSDDRGRFGEFRLYKLLLTSTFQKSTGPLFSIEVQEKIPIFKKSKKLPVFDFEGLALFKDGWILSSEGDLNSKPRVLPEIFYVLDGTIKQKITLPNDFLPKFNGKQINGLYNNKAFEGLYFDRAAGRLYLVSESGVVQKNDGDQVVYLVEQTLKEGKFVYDKTSRLDFSSKIEGNYVYSGISEITKISENTFLLLMRSVLPSLTLQYENIVWMIQRKSLQDPWEIKSKYILDPERNNDELNQNYEGMDVMEWQGSRYLVLVSDDNFKSYEKTVFSFFELEVK